MSDNFKIRIENKDHSKAVQTAMFALGYKWSGTKAELQYTDAKYLFAEKLSGKGYITYEMRDTEYFEDHSHTEKFLVDGKFMTAKEKGAHKAEPAIVEVAIRPKAAVDALHRAIDVQRLKELNAYLMHAVDSGKQVAHQEHMEYNGLLINLLSYS